jgi:predicted peptidase/chitodextrinase
MPPTQVTYTPATNVFANTVPGKLYPAILFFHGAGETGSDNNKQLIHGARRHMDNVANGNFPGFLIYPQNVAGGDDKGGALIRKLLTTLPIDPNRIYVHGLSNGAKWAWDFILRNPELVAAAAPMSGVIGELVDTQDLLYTPLRLAQGGLDSNPAPGFTQTIVDWYNQQGGQLEYFLYPTLGHGTWETMYARADFFPWFLSKAKNQIQVRYDRNEICPGDPINVDMGFSPGFLGYRWYKNGVLIAGATNHKYIATSFGDYTGEVRFLDGTWSAMSPIMQVKVKGVTTTPSIVNSALRSNVLPAPDGSTNTSLELPTGYVSYTWRNATTNAVVHDGRVFANAAVGGYTATVQEVNGCSSNPSPVYNVASANGPNKPDPVNGVLGFAPSQTQISLTWTQNPEPAFNETAFEVYRSLSETGQYTLIAITAADAIGFNDSGLDPNTHYFYKIRPVNATGAAVVSEPLDVLTQLDVVNPSTPADLRVTASTINSVTLAWTASTDNVGIDRYNIYLNGALAKTSTTTSTTVFSLSPETFYNFTIRAVDLAGNVSPLSNQITAPTVQKGLNYKYYEGAWNNLPDFTTLTPVKIGSTAGVDISVRNRNENFAFYWEGYIYIPVAGNYTFETYSDDGSMLYIGGYGAQYLVANNDGPHGMQYREGTRNLAIGSHRIVIAFAQVGGGYGMEVYWKNTAHGVTSRQLIPDVQFTQTLTPPAATPTAPTVLTATTVAYNQINLGWTDNSQTETGFQVYRATVNEGPYSVIATLPFRSGTGPVTYSDMAVNPNTRYYYRVQAIGQNGSSGFSTEKVLGLNYRYYEQTFPTTPMIDNSLPKKTGTVTNFSLTPRERDTNFGFKYEGMINITAAGVYRFFTTADDAAEFYLNGQRIVNATSANSEAQSNQINVAVGKYPIKVLMRQAGGSSRLEVRYQGPSITKQLIPNTAFNETQINALTNPLPPAPVAASGLVATNGPDKSIELVWLDNSSDETSFELQRSVSSLNNFVAYKTLDPNTTSYTDEGLFPRLTYYYKVVAKGVGGGIPTAAVSSTVPNSAPEFTSEIPNVTVRFNEERIIPITVSEADGDFVLIAGVSLPELAQLFDYGDGTGDLLVLATEEQQGVYENLKIYTRDNFGGADTLTFNITVNSNHNPVITGANPVNLRETYISRFALTATDLDAETITWEVQDAPEFFQGVPSGNTLNVTVSPLIQHAGTYDVTVIARDGQGGVDTEIIPITVTDYNPNFSIWLNFTTNAGVGGSSPWINLRTNSANGNPLVFLNSANLNLTNDLGIVTPISIALESPWTSIFTTGGVTPGLFPDNVMNTYLQTSQSTARNIRITGLNPDGKYNIKFMSSTTQTGNRIAAFSAGSQTVQLNALNNANTTANLVNLTPGSNGEIMVTVTKQAGSTYIVLNAIVIESVYEGTSVPAAPSDLVSSVTPDYKIRLNWTDNAFDETSYEVYESTDNNIFTKIATLPFDVATHDDGTFQGQATYYYKVRAVNNFGPSEYSNTLTVVGPNRGPVFGTWSAISITEMDFRFVPVTATDPDGEVITFRLENEPYFAWIEEMENGMVSLMFSPQFGDEGEYQFQLIGRDPHGAETALVVSVTIVKIGEIEMKVNFTDNNAARLAGAPWTNLFTNVTNTSVNLKDGANNTTPVSMRVVNAWSGVNVGGGYQSPDNTGVFPNAAMASSFIISDVNPRTLQFTGLKTDKLYDFTFFSSRIEGAATTPVRNTVFTIGSKTVIINALGNQSNTVKIVGIKSDPSGTVNLSVSRQSGSTYGYLNAMVIREYPGTGLPTEPSNLAAQVLSRNSVKLTWSDNSDDETSFRVLRSGPDQVYQEIANLAPNVTTFTNNLLTPGSQYFYKIRAINAIGQIDSDPVDVSTFEYAVSINFYAKNGGPSNWNNISNSTLFAGEVFPNLFDEFNANTGISMNVVVPPTASNGFGVNTGNNSGILPDNVMEGSYFIDPGAEAVLRFDNLSFLKRYSFNFFSSRASAGNRNTEFIINGTTVVLNAALNSTQMVQINNVVPALDGTVTLVVRTQTGALFGYLNALIIQAAPNPNPPQGRIAATQQTNADSEIEDGSNVLQRSIASPNPFTNVIRVNLDQPQSKIQAVLFNSVGQKVAEALVDDQAELSEFEMNINTELPSGIYILKINNGKTSAVHKMMKQ